MNTEFDRLTEREKEVLIKAPAIVAVLSALSADGIVNEAEKAEAIKLAHLRSFTSHEILNNYYKEVDKHFEKNLNETINNLPADNEQKKQVLKEELKQITPVLATMGREFSMNLIDSLKSFARHVFKSNSHFLEYFVLPVFMNDIEKQIFDEY